MYLIWGAGQVWNAVVVREGTGGEGGLWCTRLGCAADGAADADVANGRAYCPLASEMERRTGTCRERPTVSGGSGASGAWPDDFLAPFQTPPILNVFLDAIWAGAQPM